MFTLLTVVDIDTQFHLSIEVGTDYRGYDAVEALEHATRRHLRPKSIEVENAQN